ncbi:thioredoxin domain-containing protein [Balneolaceae bacterium YR4-1]|uniref:Thioredoxin domain-containing protein n=1 Tax=Halalkalibaculum roseum TaxID=2709311 RepID=A0A6M1SY88_9BACT|nr:thioredoxin domain-containing protein [Halalkalibaculum roseum]NGP77238.1 thioredoxin domain-containing protein [Halalkalibaculum roseum]
MTDSSEQNRLTKEKSPYLLQHAHNPVDWYPWGEEAFKKAKEEDKPIFLSIGYATCHWCHVMAHESFEDKGIAEMMNRAFVNIKVDREERPDIDNTYMTVCQMLTGSGGWPLTILMTPEKKPFYAATYIPKEGRYGRPGMRELIPRINGLWNNERQKVNNSAEEIIQAFQKSNRQERGEALTTEILEEAFQTYSQQYDSKKGGFGSAPKFPSPHNLMYLLRYWRHSGEESALRMVTTTLDAMQKGGLFDQVGFGFHRYSTDADWLVPHFEKMLYDQAMLTLAYTEAWQATGNNRFKETADKTIAYVLRDMQHSEGAFYSAEDADSEGEEGKFYVWSMDEIREALPTPEAELAIEVFNMTEEGNYADEASGRRTGTNILHLTKPLENLAEERNMSAEKLKKKINEIREILYHRREQRQRPLLDDKILTDWNGLMIAALAKAGKVFNDHTSIEAAEKAYSFIKDTLIREDGTLLHRFREGESAIRAHTDDYAFLIWGLLELYEATFNTDYLEDAVELNNIFIDRFWDGKQGGFYFTDEESEELLGRKKEVYDGAIPSGNSVALSNLLRIGRMTADVDLETKADELMRLYSSQVKRAPTGFGQFLQGVYFALTESYEIVIAGERDDKATQDMLNRVQSNFIPNKVILLHEPGDSKIRDLAPYVKEQRMVDDKTAAYVCRNYSCEMPTQDPRKVMNLLKI